MNQVWVGKLGAQRHLADSGLGEAGVLDIVAFLLGFELLDGIELFAGCWACAIGFWVAFDSFVDSTIRAATDKADDMVFLVDLRLGSVAVSGLSTFKAISQAIEGDMTSFLVLLGHREASHQT